MTLLRSMCIASLVCVAAGGCATARADPLACNGGSEIAFGYQHLAPVSRVLTGTQVMMENGGEYLFVDGRCRYWAYHWSTEYGMWTDVHEGVLDDTHVAALSREIIENDWAAIAASSRPTAAHDAGVAIVWHDGHVATCGGPCFPESGLVGQIVARAAAWTRTLHTSGSPPSSESMRWIVIPYEGDITFFPFSDWSGQDLADIAISPLEAATTALRYGDHRIVSGEDAAAVRALRDEYRSHVHDSFSYQFLPLLSGGLPYQVWARDSIPVEDHRGLVRPVEGAP